MIQFRYGSRTAPAALVDGPAPVVAVPPVGTPAAPAAKIYTWKTLPKNFRLQMSEEESAAIRFGGARDYGGDKKKK